MQPHGSDRLRTGDDGRHVITSRYPKGWEARKPRTLTSREHPGTAILWDDEWFEVVAAEHLPGGAMRYVLDRWPEQFAMRISDRYDGDSEQLRETEHRAKLLREKGRKTANVLGMFTGQLPASVQEQLASELGLLAPKLTLISLLPQFAYIAAVAYAFAGGLIDRVNGPSIAAVAVAVFFVIENLIRFNIAYFHNRPIGSAIGMIVYLVAYAFGVRKAGGVSPFAQPRGTAIFKTEAPEDVALRDALTTRGPLMTLLPAAEQRMLRDRYGYDYRESATTVAAIILTFSLAGAVSSFLTLSRGPSISALASLLVAGGLSIEQLVRLSAFRSGPAGSVLGFIARPFVGRLLRQ